MVNSACRIVPLVSGTVWFSVDWWSGLVGVDWSGLVGGYDWPKSPLTKLMSALVMGRCG